MYAFTENNLRLIGRCMLADLCTDDVSDTVLPTVKTCIP